MPPIRSQRSVLEKLQAIHRDDIFDKALQLWFGENYAPGSPLLESAEEKIVMDRWSIVNTIACEVVGKK